MGLLDQALSAGQRGVKAAQAGYGAARNTFTDAAGAADHPGATVVPPDAPAAPAAAAPAAAPSAPPASPVGGDPLAATLNRAAAPPTYGTSGRGVMNASVGNVYNHAPQYSGMGTDPTRVTSEGFNGLGMNDGSYTAMEAGRGSFGGPAGPQNFNATPSSTTYGRGVGYGTQTGPQPATGGASGSVPPEVPTATAAPAAGETPGAWNRFKTFSQQPLGRAGQAIDNGLAAINPLTAREGQGALAGAARWLGRGAVKVAAPLAAISGTANAAGQTLHSDAATTAAQSAGSGGFLDKVGQFATNLGSNLSLGALTPEDLAAGGRNIGTAVGRLFASSADNAAYDKTYGSPYVTGDQLKAQRGVGAGGAGGATPPPQGPAAAAPDAGNVHPAGYQPSGNGADANGFVNTPHVPNYFEGSSFDAKSAGKGVMSGEDGSGLTSGGLPIQRFNSESDPEFQQRAKAIDTTYGMLQQLQGQYANSHFLDERKMLLGAMGQLNGQLGTLTGQGVTRANAAEGNTVSQANNLMTRQLEGIRMRFAQANADRNYNLSAAQYHRGVYNDDLQHQRDNETSLDGQIRSLIPPVAGADKDGKPTFTPDASTEQAFRNYITQTNPDLSGGPAQIKDKLAQAYNNFQLANTANREAAHPALLRRLSDAVGATDPARVTSGAVNVTGTRNAKPWEFATQPNVSLRQAVAGSKLADTDTGVSTPVQDLAGNEQMLEQVRKGAVFDRAARLPAEQQQAFLESQLGRGSKDDPNNDRLWTAWDQYKRGQGRGVGARS